MRIDTLLSAGESQVPREVVDFQIVPDRQRGMVKSNVATVADVLVKQESDIQSQRMSIIQVRTAWLLESQQSDRIIAQLKSEIKTRRLYKT